MVVTEKQTDPTDTSDRRQKKHEKHHGPYKIKEMRVFAHTIQWLHGRWRDVLKPSNSRFTLRGRTTYDCSSGGLAAEAPGARLERWPLLGGERRGALLRRPHEVTGGHGRGMDRAVETKGVYRPLTESGTVSAIDYTRRTLF